jgi:homocysteine S-methyltransferase
MRDPIDNFLAQRPLMVLDGALATELERRGADLRDPLWSAKWLIDRPDLIREVHLDYFRAGADVATTAGCGLSLRHPSARMARCWRTAPARRKFAA